MWLHDFLVFSFFSSLYILNTNFMSDVELVKIFPFCSQPVHLNDSLLLYRNLSVSLGPTWSECPIGVLFRNHFPIFKCFLFWESVRFRVSGLLLKFCSVWETRIEFQSSSCSHPVPPVLLDEDVVFSPVWHFDLFVKYQVSVSVCAHVRSSVLFLWSMYLFLSNSMPIWLQLYSYTIKSVL